MIKNCVICGKPFECYGRAITCSPECRAEKNRRYRREYKRNEYLLQRKKEYDREYRQRKKNDIASRRQRQDNIIGEGYAERQIAQTLSMVEPIKTEL